MEVDPRIYMTMPIKDRPIMSRSSIEHQALLLLAYPSYEVEQKCALLSRTIGDLPTFDEFCTLPVIRNGVQDVAKMLESDYEFLGYRIVA